MSTHITNLTSAVCPISLLIYLRRHHDLVTTTPTLEDVTDVCRQLRWLSIGVPYNTLIYVSTHSRVGIRVDTVHSNNILTYYVDANDNLNQRIIHRSTATRYGAPCETIFDLLRELNRCKKYIPRSEMVMTEGSIL